MTAINEELIQHKVRELLELIGEDPTREGLIETPERVSKAYAKWFEGYAQNPEEIFKTFNLPEIVSSNGYGADTGIVTIRDIAVYSHCEHHLAPFFGSCTISYMPTANIVSGLSKFAKLVNVFARRLQVQERLCNQIAQTIFEQLSPSFVLVQMNCRHLCMESRGVCENNANTITTVSRGAIEPSILTSLLINTCPK